MNLQRIKRVILRNRWLGLFAISHIFFAASIGRFYALAPDEVEYLYTFNHLYINSSVINPQSGSGWITAPTIFLWLAYLPAKILNVVGVPDYLSIRSLSVMLITLSLYLLLNMKRDFQPIGKFSQNIIFLAFLIPSIFLWTSTGLRETFIIAELTFFFVGLNYMKKGKAVHGSLLLFLGSYGLIATKTYLWACLLTALTLSLVIFTIIGQRRNNVKILFAGVLVPLLTFMSTTSSYAVDFILKSDIKATSERSGDSISRIYVDTRETETKAETLATKELITFHGDFTLISIHSYLINNPQGNLSKIAKTTHFDKKIIDMWDNKVRLGLMSADREVGSKTASINSHLLEPGTINNPFSLILPSFLFLFGPIPFIGDPGFAIGVASLESPLWWIFYGLVAFQFVRFRKTRFLHDPQILFALLFLGGEILFSAIVEVNLGTSFRHRSIILVPLVFLYLRLAQRDSEQKENNLASI